MNKQISIDIKNLSKTFYIYEDFKPTLRSLFASFFNQGKTRKFKALDNVNLQIYKGEFFGIIGRNGSGKSTLMKIIAGIYEADKGSQLYYEGSIVPFLELGVGFNMEFTGRENIFLNGTILGMTISYLKSKFDEIVDFAEVRNYIDMPLKNYSTGMQLRLAFSIAIQSKADIYLLDEVLSVGDQAFQQKSKKMIEKLKSEGKTILYVSHSMESIIEMCDRACWINDGKLQSIGEPRDVVSKYLDYVRNL
ncbi:MAG: ABC transporter ATP-binding protein [Candidatus Dojkabacteria bacterium]|nr:ABC transporter ATP-binding protein [Candidatus Dojkabacteria bacterium]